MTAVGARVAQAQTATRDPAAGRAVTLFAIRQVQCSAPADHVHVWVSLAAWERAR